MLTKKKKLNAILLVLPFMEISLGTELSIPPPFRIQVGSLEREIHRNSSRSSRTVLPFSNIQSCDSAVFTDQKFWPDQAPKASKVSPRVIMTLESPTA